jgi:hypothetical protein
MNGFTGTEAYHKITLFPVKVTDGIKSVAEKAEAFWLFDAIASYQIKFEIRSVPFQLWTLNVMNDGCHSAILTMQEDVGTKKIVEQKFTYTTFPVGKWKFYLIGGVLLLPGEY